MYYLNSRYYDSKIGRFISSDTVEVLTASPAALTDKNLYAYCDNNPVMRVDNGGEFWETVLDVISLASSIVDVIQNPSDPLAWLGLAADVVSLAVPVLTGGGLAVKALSKADDVADIAKATNKVDDIVDIASDAKKVHGNSLKSTKVTFGYALKKNGTNEIMKFGETTRGTSRYTQKFYRNNDVYMDIMARGSKYDMHWWQHDQILNYTRKNGVRPPWNKSNW